MLTPNTPLILYQQKSSAIGEKLRNAAHYLELSLRIKFIKVSKLSLSSEVHKDSIRISVKWIALLMSLML